MVCPCHYVSHICFRLLFFTLSIMLSGSMLKD